MTFLRRLVTRPAFVPGETLRSFVVRTAARLGATITETARRIGLIDGGARECNRAFGFFLADDQRARVAHALGTTEAQIDRMTAARFPFLRIRPGFRGCEVFSTATSRACPDCLAETGGAWLMEWRLAVVHSCARHGRLLVASCRGCGRPLQSGAAPRCTSTMPYMGRVPDPLVCDNRNPETVRPCFADLVATAPPRVPAGSTAVAIDGLVRSVVGETREFETDSFTDLAELSAFTVRAGAVARKSGGPRHSAMATLAADPATSAEATALAWDILRHPPDPDRWDLLIGRLDPAAKGAKSTGPQLSYDHRYAYRIALNRRNRRSRYWVNTSATRRRWHPTGRLRMGDGDFYSGYVENPAPQRRGWPQTIPAVPWPAIYASHFEEILGPGYAGRRLAAALMLARLKDIDVPTAAAQLGWPPTTALTYPIRRGMRPLLRQATRAALVDAAFPDTNYNVGRSKVGGTAPDAVLPGVTAAERVWVVARATGAVVQVSGRRAITRPYLFEAPAAEWVAFVDALDGERREESWSRGAIQLGIRDRTSRLARPEDDPHLNTIGVRSCRRS